MNMRAFVWLITILLGLELFWKICKLADILNANKPQPAWSIALDACLATALITWALNLLFR